MWHAATIGFTKEDRFVRLICCFQLTGHCRLKVFKIWASCEDRICEVGYALWLFFLMIIGFQSMSCRSRAPSKIRDGFSSLGNNSCTFVKFLTLGCFCIATVVHSFSCKKGTSLNGQVYFVAFTKGNTIIIYCTFVILGIVSFLRVWKNSKLRSPHLTSRKQKNLIDLSSSERRNFENYGVCLFVQISISFL